mmetsp:Transcript_113165/g.365621  ORF Transcript_113165/g.365621 Transcript_113165/m.365621 type:complete len:328 (+) Transcript_113165:1010-1993(+)
MRAEGNANVRVGGGALAKEGLRNSSVTCASWGCCPSAAAARTVGAEGSIAAGVAAVTDGACAAVAVGSSSLASAWASALASVLAWALALDVAWASGAAAAGTAFGVAFALALAAASIAWAAGAASGSPALALCLAFALCAGDMPPPPTVGKLSAKRRSCSAVAPAGNSTALLVTGVLPSTKQAIHSNGAPLCESRPEESKEFALQMRRSVSMPSHHLCRKSRWVAPLTTPSTKSGVAQRTHSPRSRRIDSRCPVFSLMRTGPAVKRNGVCTGASPSRASSSKLILSAPGIAATWDASREWIWAATLPSPASGISVLRTTCNESKALW